MFRVEPAGQTVTSAATGRTIKVPEFRESRVCFSVSWFRSERDACEWSDHIQALGITVNGGFMDGAPCGRAQRFDFTTDDGVMLYAVTD